MKPYGTPSGQPVSQPATAPDERARQWRRKGLLGGLAAVAAGLLAARAASPARAADGDVLEIGNTGNPTTGPQSASSRTELNRSNPAAPIDDALRITNDQGRGITASGTIDGVFGSSSSSNGNGIRGEANLGTSAFGVWGHILHHAWRGRHGGRYGVRGNSVTPDGAGALGITTSGSPTAIGVNGVSGFGFAGFV